MKISRRIFILSFLSFFTSVIINSIFFNSTKRFIYLKKYLKEKGYEKNNFDEYVLKKDDFSQVEIDKFIAIDFKRNKIENIDGWILSEFEINMAMLPINN
tara:strand:+ start:533 stop:832 length:300 start_codon:yes stop_codon:yes gene_type:complete